MRNLSYVSSPEDGQFQLSSVPPDDDDEEGLALQSPLFRFSQIKTLPTANLLEGFHELQPKMLPFEIIEGRNVLPFRSLNPIDRILKNFR